MKRACVRVDAGGGRTGTLPRPHPQTRWKIVNQFGPISSPRRITVDDLLALLSAGNPVMAGDLAAGLSISRPVLSKLVREAGNRVIRLGDARATAYVALDRP